MIPIYRTGVFWCPESSVFCNPRSCFWSMFNNVWQKEIGTLQTKSGSECFELSSAQFCPLVMQGIFPSGSCSPKINFWTSLSEKHSLWTHLHASYWVCQPPSFVLTWKKNAFSHIFNIFSNAETTVGQCYRRDVVAGTESRCMWWQSWK